VDSRPRELSPYYWPLPLRLGQISPLIWVKNQGIRVPSFIKIRLKLWPLDRNWHTDSHERKHSLSCRIGDFARSVISQWALQYVFVFFAAFKIIVMIRAQSKVKKIVFVCPNMKSGVKNSLDLANKLCQTFSGIPLLPIRAIPIDGPYNINNNIAVLFERVSWDRSVVVVEGKEAFCPRRRPHSGPIKL